MRNTTLIHKTHLDRLVEFFQSMCIINDSINLYSQGKKHQLIPLYGQLRAILTDNAKKNVPLMKDIAEIIDVKLEVYYSELGLENEDLPKPVFQMSNLFLGLEKEVHHQKLIDLFEFIEKPTIKVKANEYKLSEIIDFLANKSGGAHYAKRIETFVAELFSINSFKINSVSPIEQLLLQFAKVVFELGYRILKKLTSLHIVFSYILEDQKINSDSILFDFCLNNTPLRLIIFLSTEKKIGITVIDAFGYQYSFISQKSIDFAIDYKICDISLKLTNSLQTQILLRINNEDFINQSIDIPILFINELSNYDFYVNRSKEKYGNGLCISHGHMTGYDSIDDETERNDNINNFKSEFEKSNIFRKFFKDSYGKKNNEKNITDFIGKFEEVKK